MNIYVGNLDRQAEEKELKQLFTMFGEVKSVKIIKDNLSGEPRGFAFVEMTEDTSANLAIKELHMKQFGEKKLKVNEAKPKSAAPRVFNSFSSNYGYGDRNNR